LALTGANSVQITASSVISANWRQLTLSTQTCAT